MRRMVKEYTTRYYVPEIQQGVRIEQKQFERARVLANWKTKVMQAWPGVEIYVDARRDGQLSLGESIEVHAWIKTQKLTPDDLSVELVYGNEHADQPEAQEKLFLNYIRQELDGSYRYELRLQPATSGSIAYGIRVLPAHPELSHKHEMGLMYWA
jgi:starch phosphorylase